MDESVSLSQVKDVMKYVEGGRRVTRQGDTPPRTDSLFDGNTGVVHVYVSKKQNKTIKKGLTT